MPYNRDVQQAQIRVAQAYRRKARDPREITRAHTEHNEAKVHAFAEEALATMPPHLTTATQKSLARLAKSGVSA